MDQIGNSFIVGIPVESEQFTGTKISEDGFPLKDYIGHYEPRDPLDEALQPVFELLAKDYPGHLLVVTATNATLERHAEVQSYLNIAAARAVWTKTGNEVLRISLQKVIDTATSLLNQTKGEETR